MRAARRRAIWTLALVVGALAALAPSTRATLGRVVLHAEDLRRAGVTRLADIVLLVEDWRPTTVDGFTWRGASSLGLYDGRQWQVQVDGKPLAIDIFATSALNRVPVSMTQIDSIEVFTLPAIHNGRFVDAGLIHVHTIRLPAGWSGGARVFAGNETGEPGPYQFTELRTPNVERIGPDYSLDAARGGRAGFARATYAALRSYAYDNATATRNEAIVGGTDLHLDVEGGMGRARLRIGESDHDVLIGGSRFDDFYFLKPYGREIPARARTTLLAASGRLRMGASRSVSYRVGYSRNEVAYRQNALSLDLDWAYDRTYGELELEYAGATNGVTAGFGVERTEVETAFELGRSKLETARVYADTYHRGGGRLENRIGALLLLGEDDVAFNAVWQASAQTRGHRLEANLSYAERVPECDDRIWYWDERGYEFLGDNGVEITRHGSLDVARRASADFAWRPPAARQVTCEARIFWRFLWDQYVERQGYQYDATDKSFLGPVGLFAGERGAVAGVKLAVNVNASKNLETRLVYEFQSDVGADAELAAAWDAVARHHFRVAARYTVNRKFGLWALFSYWSATHWRDYEAVEIQSGGEYAVRLPAIALLDVGLDKWFWHERVRGNVLFRNALDRTVRFHPVGATFDLTVFLQIEVLWGMPRP